MTSTGSGSQFLLRRGGEEDSEGEGRKRGVLTRDVEVQVMRNAMRCPRSGRSCHVAYKRTSRKSIEKDTHICWVLVMGVICTHLDVEGGRTLLHGVCMHARTQENVGLEHTSIRP